MGGKIIGSIPDGSMVTIYGDTGNGWYIVNYNGQTGYASSQFIVAGQVGKNAVAQATAFIV